MMAYPRRALGSSPSLHRWRFNLKTGETHREPPGRAHPGIRHDQRSATPGGSTATPIQHHQPSPAGSCSAASSSTTCRPARAARCILPEGVYASEAPVRARASAPRTRTTATWSASSPTRTAGTSECILIDCQAPRRRARSCRIAPAAQAVQRHPQRLGRPRVHSRRLRRRLTRSNSKKKNVRMEIKDSVALVTGGNRGIGEAFVRAFLKRGRRPGLCRRPATSGQRPAPGRRRLPAAWWRSPSTSARPDQVVAAAERNATDRSHPGQQRRPVLRCRPSDEGAPDHVERARRDGGQLFRPPGHVPRLRAHPRPSTKQSAIANVLSAGGIVAVPGMGGYSPSKFAARAMTTCVRAELAPQNTSVTALIVGSVDTRMASHVEGFRRRPPALHRRGRPEARSSAGYRRGRHRLHGRRRPRQPGPRPQGLRSCMMRRSLTAERVTTGR
jgi:NAD(P)-dependent dehydrogenase (short-subunit alcohol dehydrogenase family)